MCDIQYCSEFYSRHVCAVSDQGQNASPAGSIPGSESCGWREVDIRADSPVERIVPMVHCHGLGLPGTCCRFWCTIALLFHAVHAYVYVHMYIHMRHVYIVRVLGT